MSIKAIIFDIGGVILWGSVPVFAPAGSPLVDAGKTSAWREWDAGMIDVRTLQDRLTAHYGDLAAVQQLISRVLDPERPFIQETVDAVTQLKKQGYQLYILSNFSWEARDRFITGRPAFFDQFEGIVCSCFMGITKPYLGIYSYLFEKYHLDPAACLFIDDSPENIKAAQSLGMHAFLFNAATFQKELEAYRLFDS